MKQLNLQNFENIEKLSIESAEARNIPWSPCWRMRSTYYSDCSVERLKDYRFAICLFSLKMRAKQVREIDLEQLDFGTTENGYRYVRNLN